MRVTNGELETSRNALIYVKEYHGFLSQGNEVQLNYINDILEARAQNAELLAALKEIESGNLFVGDAQNRKDIVTEYARAAIAKMEADK